jgi:hypothetical protein
VNGRATVDRWLPEANLPPVLALGTV